MPKVTWEGNDGDTITADDIEGAEEGYQAYAGDLPPAGVYRFKIRRVKFRKSNEKGTPGLNNLLILDGSWKPEHRKYDGAPMWDDVWMTKSGASFVKAYAAGIGVTAADLVNKVVVDDDGYVTKIGTKTIAENSIVVYVAVKRDNYNDNPRIVKAGTGYQIVEADDEQPAAATKTAKAAPAKAAKGKGKKSKNDDDEPPF